MSVRHPPKVLIAAVALLGAATVQAADLNLANIPLFLGQSAHPNILFMIDDSGSMNWEAMTTDLTHGGVFTANQPDGSNENSAGSVKHRSGCGFNYYYGSPWHSTCSIADRQSWRFRNKDFNPLYFDPSQTYSPWAGVNSSGAAFADMPVTRALEDPYRPSSRTVDLTEGNCPTQTVETNQVIGTERYCKRFRRGRCARYGRRNVYATIDIRSGYRYYDWNDSDGDGLFDNGEETEHVVCDLTPAQQTNFANWFSYYRSRALVAKAAYGQLIAQARDQRMGMVTLHNNSGSSNIAIAEMNSDPASGAKKALLDALYTFSPGNGTPLRRISNESGKYLSCDLNSFGFTTCPRLSLADGGQCQQNFLVMMTDGLWNGGSPGVGNTDGDDNTAFDGGSYADRFSNMLADVAMKYYENDIHTDYPNDLPVIAGIDEATHQHVVTYTVAFGVNGTVSAMPQDPAAAFSWPQGRANTATAVDDLRHAAYNGRGQFLSARSSQELIDALNAAILSIGQRTSSASAAAVNMTKIQTGAQVYQARFDSSDWSGQFLAFQLALDGTPGALLGDAATFLDAVSPSSRTILTAQNGTGISLRWGDLSATQKGYFRTNPSSGAVENVAAGRARLDFIRGDRSNEGVTPYFFRIRGSVLGDLVHSSPVYVGPDTSFGYPETLETNSYADFVANTVAGRAPTIYIGSNDGFLHGFNADASPSNVNRGQEEIAYLPEVLLPEINKLTNRGYNHQFYVDGDSTYGDVYFNSAWHSALVGSLRHGGQGYFALDVSDPANFTESNASNVVLWEFTDADDADLGYSYGSAAIVKLSNGQWAAVFGNGYNATEADGNASSSGDAVLYLVDIEDGSLIRKISTKVGMAEDPTGNARPNGLASPAVVDFDGDFVADYVYAGDLFGHLWKFDIRDSDPDNWEIPLGTAAVPLPLFTAEIDMGRGFAPNTSPNIQPQPITALPAVGFHPDGQGLLIYFGTGQYMEVGDHSSTGEVTQSFYAVWDDFPTSSSPPGISRSNMLQQAIITELTVNRGSPVEGRKFTRRLIDWSTDKGWFLDLYNTDEGRSAITDNFGERVTSGALLRNGQIIFTTNSPTGDQCSSDGTSWITVLDAYQGSRLGYASFDVNGDGTFTDAGDNVSEQLTVDDNGDGIVTTRTESMPLSAVRDTSGMILGGVTVVDGTRGTLVALYGTTDGSIKKQNINAGPDREGRTSWQLLR